MLYYIAHAHGGNAANIEKAKKITHDLQINDTENTYVCPLLAFSHLKYGEIEFDTEMELCLDLLTVCDKLIVASNITKGVRQEIEFAERVGMEVEYIDTWFWIA